MQSKLRNIAIAGVAAVGVALASGAAQAQHWHGGHGGWHGGGGFGPGFVGGLALGAVAGAPYGYGGGYGPAYAYGDDCYITRHVVIDRFGRRLIRRVRVCD
jgi:hypothetical protein